MEIRLFDQITDYENLIEFHPYGHYMKTNRWASLNTHVKTQSIGFYSHNEVVGTALLWIDSFMGIKYGYIPYGLCIDYENQELHKEAIDTLVEYAKGLNIAFLRMDPNVLRCEKDIEGNIIPEGSNHEYVTELLKDKGFIHKGYGYAYDGSFTNRYTLVVDMNKPFEEVIKSFNKNKKTSFNKHTLLCVTTRKGSLDELHHLCTFEKELFETEGSKPHSEAFFRNILETFKEDGRYYVTEIDLASAVEKLEIEVSSKKYKKDLEAKLAKEKELEKIKELKAKYGDKTIIAGGLFLTLGKKSWDLYTYNERDFDFLSPVDSLHLFAMKDFYDKGVTFYDMCGFSGVTDRSDPYYGLYAYKKSFGSKYYEQLGEFDYVFNPKKYKSYKFLRRGVNKVKRTYHIRRYKKK
ncbi:MAG: peptidoglycan bridge formation glycyltransferase FemA/FemB family protein [Erysipelotrichaceae bacterium]|nr:peptidoglycan bridge formation glycyltransferase FemA/FemB family protein [Erysipelotrichaceae bacterium]